MIYGRYGAEATIKRVAVLADVQKFEGYKPNKRDRKAIADGVYIVVELSGKETLYHLAYLRADGGINEIYAAIDAAKVHSLERPKA